MKIKTLIKRIEREAKPDQFGDACISFSREDQSDNFDSLRGVTRIELEKIRRTLSETIPNDFDYNISIEDRDVDAFLEYNDGSEAGAGCDLDVDFTGDYVKGLKKMDWDRLRESLISDANIQDDAAEIAEELPGKLPSTSEAQIAHGDAYEAFLKKTKDDKCQFAILAYDDCAGKYAESVLDKSDHLLAETSNFLVLAFPIIAIVNDGKLLNADEIEELKLQVLEGCGPISKAKALGQFGEAMNLMKQ